MKKITDLKKGDLLTVDTVSETLGIPKKTLYEWHAKAVAEPDKYPRGVKLGRHLFFLKSELIDHINRRHAA